MTLLMAFVLAAPLTVVSQTESAPQPRVLGPVSMTVPATSWVGDEDLLMVLQSFVAMGAAAAVGVVALFPAHVGFFGLLLVALFTQWPALLLAGPALMLGMVTLLQALFASGAVWLVGSASPHFRARSHLPETWAQALKNNAGIDAKRGLGRALLGLPWLAGFAGYLTGAGLGLLAGAAVSVPLIAAGLAVYSTSPANPVGAMALIGGSIAAAMVLAASVTLTAPPFAAVAYHLVKEPIVDEK
jgi:hypothetical protein